MRKHSFTFSVIQIRPTPLLSPIVIEFRAVCHLGRPTLPFPRFLYVRRFLFGCGEPSLWRPAADEIAGPCFVVLGPTTPSFVARWIPFFRVIISLFWDTQCSLPFFNILLEQQSFYSLSCHRLLRPSTRLSRRLPDVYLVTISQHFQRIPRHICHRSQTFNLNGTASSSPGISTKYITTQIMDEGPPPAAHTTIYEGESLTQSDCAMPQSVARTDSSASHDSTLSQPTTTIQAPIPTRPRLPSRKSSGTIIVPRDSEEASRPMETRLDPGDVRAMSPRRTSEDLEQLGRQTRAEVRKYVVPSSTCDFLTTAPTNSSPLGTRKCSKTLYS